MRATYPSLLLTLAFTASGLGCGGDWGAPPDAATARSKGDAPVASDGGPSARHDPAPKGSRTLGLHVGEAEDRDYGAAFSMAREAGVEVVHLSLDWGSTEPAPNRYDGTLLSIAEAYYPPSGVMLSLTLRPINSYRLQVPSDLEGVAFDDQRMIERFNKYLDFVFAQIPSVELHTLVIGNELDACLTKSSDWRAYGRFFRATRDHAKRLRPGVRVGVTAQFDGLVGRAKADLRELNEAADFVSLTYYGIGPGFEVKNPAAVGEDFDRLVALYPRRKIIVQECGYPSSRTCGSSEKRQRRFVVEAFRAWDRHAESIEHISFFKQTEWSRDEVKVFEQYYGISEPAFGAFLGTLGFRHAAGSGSPKPAWNAFTAEAAARGW